MIVCRECGHRNGDRDTFCGQCGRFLEWTGDKIAAAKQAETPAPPEQQQRRGLISRVIAAIVDEPQPETPPKSAAPVALLDDQFPPPPPPPPGLEPPPPPPPPPPGMWDEDFFDSPVPPPPPADLEPRPAGHGLAVPVVRDEPPADPPHGELLPQDAQPRRPTVRHDSPVVKAKPGDLICGECGEGNPQSRKFCHRCGHSLAGAELARRPWYRRLVPRRRTLKVLPAGQRLGHASNTPVRRSVRGTWRFVRRTLWIVLLAFALLAGFYPPLRTAAVNAVTGVKQKVSHAADKALSPVRPATVTASAQVTGHQASAAFDEFANTYWSAQWSPDHQPSITIDLGKPTTVVKALFTSGASDAFTSVNRPSIINLAYSNEKSDTITLSDSPKPQEISLPHAIGAKTVRIQVLAVYPAQGSDAVAIAEIEMFALT